MLTVGSLKEWLGQFPDDTVVQATDFEDNIVKVDLKIMLRYSDEPIELWTIHTIGVE